MKPRTIANAIGTDRYFFLVEGATRQEDRILDSAAYRVEFVNEAKRLEHKRLTGQILNFLRIIGPSEELGASRVFQIHLAEAVDLVHFAQVYGCRVIPEEAMNKDAVLDVSSQLVYCDGALWNTKWRPGNGRSFSRHPLRPPLLSLAQREEDIEPAQAMSA